MTTSERDEAVAYFEKRADAFRHMIQTSISRSEFRRLKLGYEAECVIFERAIEALKAVEVEDG